MVINYTEHRREYYETHREQWREYNKRNRQGKLKRQREYCNEQKLEVLSHYSGGQPQCKSCGITDVDVLTIDHINGGGNQHKKITGSHIARWIIDNNFPEGFQVLCFNCNWKKRMNSKQKMLGGAGIK